MVQQLNQRAAHNAIYFNFQDAITLEVRSESDSRSVLKDRVSKQTIQRQTIIEGQRIKLPKIALGSHVSKTSTPRHYRVVISKTAHRWFGSITVDTFHNDTVHDIRHPIVGVDVGIKHWQSSEGIGLKP